LANIQRQSYWDVYFYICPKSMGITPILNKERNRAELSALSQGHALTDELNLWVVLCTLVSLYSAKL